MIIKVKLTDKTTAYSSGDFVINTGEIKEVEFNFKIQKLLKEGVLKIVKPSEP
jgi:hypothetical protein